MDNLISVIVPVYNVEAYLERCVASITGQTYRNLEIILVDDGSPDRCPEICDQIAASDPRVKVIHKPNGGLSSARNAGIDAANGDYISFVDSDDLISLDLYERLINLVIANDIDIVCFDVARINEKGEIWSHTENFDEGMISHDAAIIELLKGNINNYAINKFYKKEAFEKVRFPEGRLWEDMATTYKLFLNTEKIYCYPEKLYFYYTRSDSISKNITEKALGHIFLARYEFHMAIMEKMPSAVKYSLPLAALAARRLYDRSLWKAVDMEILSVAKRFLEENREDILTVNKDKKLLFYYKFPKFYRMGRIAKHKIGVVVKKLKGRL